MLRRHCTLTLLEGERWWGGLVDDGTLMPFGGAPHQRDLSLNLEGNQGTPLLLSNRGRYVWSEEPYSFAFAAGSLELEHEPGTLSLEEGHGNLQGAFRHASAAHFPPSETLPDALLFTAPQYNTWIEMGYEPTQAKVLDYARSALAHGFPPGVLIIDDSWQEDYGTWSLHPERFPDPGTMVDELHGLGFKVMLWVCPFVSPDSPTFRLLEKRGFLIKDETGDTAVRRWWNGLSALLDFTNEGARAWFDNRLDTLVQSFGIDGFKLDAGDPTFYRPGDLCAQPTSPTGQCEAWARVGLRFSLNEYRACWKLGGQPLVQRLKDKGHVWGEHGLASLIPNGIAQGLAGYAYTCPDMIGGGDIETFARPDFRFDAELFVRYAQCAALFPMMQFSTAPWHLDERYRAYCREATQLHTSFAPEILRLARHASVTGEPIIRHLAYVFPDEGLERVMDQFMLGDRVLVAPVVERGAKARKVVFPEGRWAGDDGSTVQGPTTVEVAAPLSRLPWYRRLDASSVT